MPDSFKTIKFEIDADGIATVTLNRPEKLNAMNAEMRSEFKVLGDELISNDQIRVIVFTGA
ncbi:enoyl-CoA hydratase, partial [candidate division KSB1 bacterium]|nr:enoyl-CoA hydratase [candidate division KSB1 bacterium]